MRSTALVGEGPAWSAHDSQLVWVDIPAGHVHRSDVREGSTSTTSVGCSVGAAIPTVHNDLVLACELGFALLRGADLTLKAAWQQQGHRMNDAKCDAAGRLWAGSTSVDFTAGAGALHVLTPDWDHRLVVDGFTLPNGLGWSPDSTVLYLVDSVQRTVFRFDYDLDTAALSNRQTFFQWTSDEGLPDGLTVDADGCVWLAIWGGGRIVRISPTGEPITELELPVRQPSSCTFGGPSWDTLYVTSARDGLDLPDDGPDGSVFQISGLGVVGQPTELFGLRR